MIHILKKIFEFIIVCVLGTDLVDPSVIFTLHDDNDADWFTAKFRCEALGERLAVLDTAEKRHALDVQRM